MEKKDKNRCSQLQYIRELEVQLKEKTAELEYYKKLVAELWDVNDRRAEYREKNQAGVQTQPADMFPEVKKGGQRG